MINVKFKIKESGSIDDQILEIKDKTNELTSMIDMAEVCKKYIKKINIKKVGHDLKIVSSCPEFYQKVNIIRCIGSSYNIMFYSIYEFEHENIKYSIQDLGYNIFSLSDKHYFYSDRIDDFLKKLRKNKNFNKNDLLKMLAREYIQVCNGYNYKVGLSAFVNIKYNYETNLKEEIISPNSKKYLEFFNKYINIC